MSSTVHFNEVSHIEVFPLRSEEYLKRYTFVAKTGEEYHRKYWRVFPSIKLVEDKKADIADCSLWECDNGWGRSMEYLNAEDLYYAKDVVVEKSKGKQTLRSRWCVRIYFLNGRFLDKKFDSEAYAKNWIKQVFGDFSYNLSC